MIIFGAVRAQHPTFSLFFDDTLIYAQLYSFFSLHAYASTAATYWIRML
jgi:hypothetical protein